MTDPVQPSDTKPVEQHAKDLKIPAWELGAAKASLGWAEGRELTVKEFMAGIVKVRKAAFH
jgi:hypothetical protein